MEQVVDHYTYIHFAARDGDADALRRELKRGVSPNMVSPERISPLHLAASARGASDDYLACVRLLIDAGANLSLACQDGNLTALMYAVGGGHSTLVATLLDAGADANSRDETGWTPLHYALCTDRGPIHGADCTRLLINAGADADARCEDGNSPLDNCISQREAYLQRGLDAESEGQRRLYPLLLRAGAALPAQSYDPYIQKVIAAGSFRTYERNHLNAIAATFLPKLPSLPPEMVRRVVEYAFHVGDY
jgi:ankyrin repeat protein